MTASRLYFAQHGLAVSKSDNPERPLSEDGIRQTRSMARHLLHSAIPVSCIFHSGKLRAQRTAEIFSSILNIEKLAAIKHLSPNDDIALIRQQLNIESALYVGHLPHLEKLISSLVTGNESPVVIKFQNSAVACLEKNDSSYHISWYLTPQLAGSE
ncbi:MAG: phosphohistidine phosphatase SixA [Gammaproteobacteria bacterium]|jgi:phosphohistidine phosphatase|nr:phosphohistidine phosphatase SixA [Gammaproteobacteria bacterium]